jgi:hypothetical protein
MMLHLVDEISFADGDCTAQTSSTLLLWSNSEGFNQNAQCSIRPMPICVSSPSIELWYIMRENVGVGTLWLLSGFGCPVNHSLKKCKMRTNDYLWEVQICITENMYGNLRIPGFKYVEVDMALHNQEIGTKCSDISFNKSSRTSDVPVLEQTTYIYGTYICSLTPLMT